MLQTKTNKTILILGATSDMAIPLLNKIIHEWKNCEFYLLARNTSPLSEIKLKGENSGHRIHLITFDILSSTSINFTNIQYAIVFVGWFPNKIKDANKTMQINYLGIKFFLEKLIDSNKNCLEQIMITGSVAGVRFRPKNKDYGAAKQALHQYAQQLQTQYSTMFCTTLVIPGFVKTKMIAGMKTPDIITISPKILADKYFKWMHTKPKKVYSQFAWRGISFVLKNLPEAIVKRMKF